MMWCANSYKEVAPTGQKTRRAAVRAPPAFSQLTGKQPANFYAVSHYRFRLCWSFLQQTEMPRGDSIPARHYVSPLAYVLHAYVSPLMAAGA